MLTTELLADLIKESEIDIDASLIGASCSFSEAGVDSLDLYELLSIVESAHSIKIEDSEIEELDSFEDIIELVNRKIGS